MPGKNESGELLLTRVVNAPRELVWKVYTEEKHLLQWWGPAGMTMMIGKLEFRPGGTFLYGMKGPDGNEMWGKFVYREIIPPSRLVFVVSFTDKNGTITRHPMSPGWPLETLSDTTFEEENGKTKITVRWKAINASEEECKLFDASHMGMNAGMEGTFKQLDAYLGTIQK
ncbi:MAG TPA: SRPBCC domain-containing protein [Bacteroidia bacterium]|jgi:uncharacterized protein YndB with AHSA1/START domain|nr:SRPBCC domain-containing protein [Bacteroidia bacterium]